VPLTACPHKVDVMPLFHWDYSYTQLHVFVRHSARQRMQHSPCPVHPPLTYFLPLIFTRKLWYQRRPGLKNVEGAESCNFPTEDIMALTILILAVNSPKMGYFTLKFCILGTTVFPARKKITHRLKFRGRQLPIAFPATTLLLKL